MKAWELPTSTMFSRDRCRHACMHLFIVKKNTQHLFPAARLAARLTEETMCAPAPPRAIFKSCRRSPLHAIPFAMFLKPTPMQERTKVMDRSSALILYTAHTHTHTPQAPPLARQRTITKSRRLDLVYCSPSPIGNSSSSSSSSLRRPQLLVNDDTHTADT